MKTKAEIIKLYLSDLIFLVPESPARDNRIAMLKSELAELDKPPEFPKPRTIITSEKESKSKLKEINDNLNKE